VRATQFGYSIFELKVFGLTTVPPVTGGDGTGGNGNCPWVGSTAPVSDRVQQVLNTMDRSEELTLVAGDGTSNYIGHVAGIPNLCIPALNLQDGPSGVGDGTGGVTAFPDGENAAATWDPAPTRAPSSRARASPSRSARPPTWSATRGGAAPTRRTAKTRTSPGRSPRPRSKECRARA
jgi:hypothetical protein